MAAPNKLPMPAVTAIASELQAVTRTTPLNTFAPPVFAATPPRKASEHNAEITIEGISIPVGTSNTTASGNAAHAAKLSADTSAACKGFAIVISEIPSSSRACAPSASCAMSFSDTRLAI